MFEVITILKISNAKQYALLISVMSNLFLFPNRHSSMSGIMGSKRSILVDIEDHISKVQDVLY